MLLDNTNLLSRHPPPNRIWLRNIFHHQSVCTDDCTVCDINTTNHSGIDIQLHVVDMD